MIKLGMFAMPLHLPERELSDTLEEDCDKVIYADQLGYDEFFLGEHMTCSTETIPAPLIVLASLLPRTKHIKLAPGVIALPNHHPLVVAAEVALFDHLSRGRFIFGFGSGGLASDMEAFGVLDTPYRTERTMEAIDTILQLWSQDPPYNINGKHWQITIKDLVVPELRVGYIRKPYQKPYPELMMTGMSPYSSTIKEAARRGFSVTSANFCPQYVVKSHWQKYKEGCELAGRPATGEDWRVSRNIVIAPSDAEAHDRVMSAINSNYYYFDYLWKVLKSVDASAIMKDDPKTPDESITTEQLVNSMVIYGSPKTVAEKLIAFREDVGPFHGLLLAAMDGSGPNRAWEYETMSRLASEVMPALRRAAS